MIDMKKRRGGEGNGKGGEERDMIEEEGRRGI